MGGRAKAARQVAASNVNAFIPVGAHTTNGSIATATLLTPPTDDINCLLIQANTRDVRYTIDGTTAPTATTGFLLVAGAAPILIYLTHEGMNVRVIETIATGAIQYQWGQVRDE